MSTDTPEPYFDGQRYVTVELPAEAQAALTNFMIDHRDEVTELLKPWDINPLWLTVPTWSRVIDRREITDEEQS